MRIEFPTITPLEYADIALEVFAKREPGYKKKVVQGRRRRSVGGS
jgi:hypothetical protein